MAELKLALLVGDESKKFLLDLTKQIDRLEKLSEISEVKAPENFEQMEFADAEATQKKLLVEEDEDFTGKLEAVNEIENEDDEAEVPVKKKKAKKLTIDDCNDAAKALARSIGGKAGREKVLGLMKKHFNTESVSELEEADFEKFCDMMRKNTK